MSDPNGIMHRARTGFLPTRGVCLIFPIGPELRHARFSLPPPCVCMRVRVSRPFFTSALVLHPLVSPASFLSASRSVRCCAPDKRESRPTPVCAPDTIAFSFSLIRIPSTLFFLLFRPQASSPLCFPPYTPFVFSSVALRAHRDRREPSPSSRCRPCRPPPLLRQDAFHPGTAFCIRVLVAGWKNR